MYGDSCVVMNWKCLNLPVLKEAGWCAASRQAQLAVMDIFNAAKIQLGQVLKSTEGR